MKKENVILIVDQNLNRKNNLSTRLRMLGYHTELISSGFQVLSKLEETKENNLKVYRLVLIIGDSEDMPGREIILLSREVRKDKAKLPILYVSSENDPDEILQTLKEGANDYLVVSESEGPIVSKVQKLAPL
ncbi:MAG: response regulator [Halobacteriovoraceae bacterium]|nr:response regulator [Halobacteriovoraceae bacterium]